jgi:hypothetical protein
MVAIGTYILTAIRQDFRGRAICKIDVSLALTILATFFWSSFVARDRLLSFPETKIEV